MVQVDDARADVAGGTVDVAPGAGGAERGARSRRLAAFAIGASLALVPMLVSVGVVVAATAATDRRGLAWWAAVILVSVVAAWCADRAAQRLLPLVGLYRLALVFPADVPSRLGLALRAGTIRELDRSVIDLRDDPNHDPAECAARIVALAGALHRHDRFTRGHSERVRAYTDLLADELGLPKEDRERLRWAALLHDIGKLEVPTTLLNKPSKLDDHEWLEMRTHPVHGAELAEPLRTWLGEWVGAVGQHHERFDGNGYPNGVAGTDISLAGRIVAVADAYETMTARRPYKKPMPHEAARAELVAQAGKHFDPRMVRAMLRLSVRRLRWAAGPLSIVGDAIAASVVTTVGAPGLALAGAIGAAPAVGATAAIVVGASVAPPPADPGPPPAPAPAVVHEVTTTSGPTTTTVPVRGAGVGPQVGGSRAADAPGNAPFLPPGLARQLDGGTWSRTPVTLPPTASPKAEPRTADESRGERTPDVTTPAVTRPAVTVPENKPELPSDAEVRAPTH